MTKYEELLQAIDGITNMQEVQELRVMISNYQRVNGNNQDAQINAGALSLRLNAKEKQILRAQR